MVLLLGYFIDSYNSEIIWLGFSRCEVLNCVYEFWCYVEVEDPLELSDSKELSPLAVRTSILIKEYSSLTTVLFGNKSAR